MIDARKRSPLLAQSKIALARVDVAKLRMAAACQVNWLPYVVGPMALRPGLFYVGEVLGDAPAKLVRFIFSKLDTALIELTASRMRVSRCLSAAPRWLTREGGTSVR